MGRPKTLQRRGRVVEDLDETVGFLALLGFDCGEPGVFSGEWIDRIIGLDNVTVETVMAPGLMEAVIGLLLSMQSSKC